MTRRWIASTALALGVASCDAGSAIASAGAATQGTVDDATRTAADKHVGTFVFSGGAKEREALKAAIDDVVAEMNVLTRAIARDRLLDSNRVPERVTIQRNEEVLVIAFDERRYEASLDGSTKRVKGVTGDMVDYRVKVSAARIRQSFVGDKGGRRNDLRRVGDDGLRVEVEVTSPSLPKPLRYRLSFRRE